MKQKHKLQSESEWWIDWDYRLVDNRLDIIEYYADGSTFTSSIPDVRELTSIETDGNILNVEYEEI